MTQAAAGSPPPRVLRCRTVAHGGFRSLSHVRDLPPILLEEQSGSPDAAPTASPSEALLAALGACLSSRIHANAVSGNIVVHNLELDVEVTVATSPMWAPPGRPPASIGFDAVRITVRLHADAEPEALQALVSHAVLWSRVANTIHDPVHLDVVLVDPLVAPG